MVSTLCLFLTATSDISQVDTFFKGEEELHRSGPVPFDKAGQNSGRPSCWSKEPLR